MRSSPFQSNLVISRLSRDNSIKHVSCRCEYQQHDVIDMDQICDAIQQMEQLNASDMQKLLSDLKTGKLPN
jgi:hypothetical protein